MKAEDFRIGNYYNHNGNIRKITPLVLLDLYNSIERDWFSPIQLTEELLLKCGFSKYSSCNSLDPETNIEWYEIANFCIVKWSDISPFYFSNHNMRIEIKYVHQLQNIYYVLTGEELTLKENI